MFIMNNKWNYDIIKEHASHYKTKNEFKHGNNSAYNYARKHNMLDVLYKK
jgi:hypothetical protein